MIRVRFAPSPTGHLHIGNFRTALFNWLFARHHGGKFLLRIEDTDRQRSNEIYEKSIMSSLKWTGLIPDEPPLIQSTRIDQHRKVIQDLVDRGYAYPCFCTQEDVRARIGGEQDDERQPVGYDGFCRDHQPEDSTGKARVIRFKVPVDATIKFEDAIYGPIQFDLNEFDDFIIERSDGSPTYNLVVVVDDAFMGITHVIRGEDHISNTPKQIMLYQACGYELPIFAHIPLILGPGGQRLSKRDAATSILDYQIEGYLSDALCNYLVRLGWAHGDQEIFTRAQMIELFTLEDVNKSSAAFDLQKLLWINSVYIKEKTPNELLDLIERDVMPGFKTRFSHWPLTNILKAISLYQQRVNTLKELVVELEDLYQGPEKIDENVRVSVDERARLLLTLLLVVFKDLSPQAWESENLKTAIKDFCKEQGIKLPEIALPLRLVLLGKASAPGIFELVEVIGKDGVVSRMENFLQS